jgi:hypothetical protein
VNKVDILGYLAQPIHAPVRMNIGINSTSFFLVKEDDEMIGIYYTRAIQRKIAKETSCKEINIFPKYSVLQAVKRQIQCFVNLSNCNSINYILWQSFQHCFLFQAKCLKAFIKP